MKKAIIGIAVAGVLCAVILPKVLTKKQFAEAVSNPIVEVRIPEHGDISLTTDLIGKIEPEDVVYVYPKASGDITSIDIKPGTVVQAGQLLCTIDTKQVDSAKNSLDSAELSLKQAKEELSRQSALYASGGISEQTYTQYQDSVKSAQIGYDNAKINYDNQLSYSQVKAPIGGTIELCDVEVYDTVAQSNLICVISGEGAKVVSFSVTEQIRKNLHEGDQIQIEKDHSEYTGIIYEVSSMADSSTGLFKIKARMERDSSDIGLPTGSMVKLSVISESVTNVMTVPVDCVYYDGGLSYVYTYDQGTVHKTEVQTGLYDSSVIEIQSGLSGNEQVLTTWNTELYEGSMADLKTDTEQSEISR